jgi:murein DD-endopeptidase / murein LD-carboxypeptidase
MKKLLYINILLFLLIGSSWAQTKIITSKAEAIKKKVYQVVAQKTIDETPKPLVLAPEIIEKPLTTTAPEDDATSTDEFFEPEKPEEIKYAENPEYNNYFAEELVSNIKENLGSRYVIGGTSKSGFDCSGLMYATFGKFGVTLPRTANEQSRFGLRIKPIEAKKGDLIFFKTNGRKVINHVGMVVDTDADGIVFIHSSTNNGVIISNTKEGYYKKAMAQVNRVLKE